MHPQTFLVGITQPDYNGLKAYLAHTQQSEFMEQLEEWMAKKNGDPLCLVSFYAKLCYKSLVLGKNANVNKIRDIEDNLTSTIKSGHGSVFEHVWLNFVTTGCSRVFTHELVRHRVGTAFSQTSGRYVALDEISLVLPPELSPKELEDMHECPNCLGRGPMRDHSPCSMCHDAGLISVAEYVETCRVAQQNSLKTLRSMLVKPDMDFAVKKRLTSAIRRLAPNGQDNEIGWSCNVRSLRHMIEMRTSLAAEWEIRVVFDQVAKIVYARWPLMLYGEESGGVSDDITERKSLKL